MNRITIQNYRCFRESQSARLAPLTLLVGNNSTGKTSFLALIRALWEVAFLNESPDFQKDPYDLGTFRDIAHNSGRGGGQANSFEAGFEYSRSVRRDDSRYKVSFSVTFEEHGISPFPVARRIAKGQTRLEVFVQEDGNYAIDVSTSRFNDQYKSEYPKYTQDDTRLLPIRFFVRDIVEQYKATLISLAEDSAINGNNLNKEDIDKSITELSRELDDLTRALSPLFRGPSLREPSLRGASLGGPSFRRPSFRGPPFAAAPVRSRPRRTYDPIRPSQDPEGEYIPTYLASISLSNQKEWSRLKDALEDFGTVSGLFDEITIKSLGKTEGTPFQVQIRKSGKRRRRRRKGPFKNLIDVGYGVSQALPVITELMREDRSSPQMFLLQQPEVHLHPSAQAALGSLFCSIVADSRRQIIVETHSDHLLDRVRMDVRDKKTSLRPKDVSILFFERDELDVNIHSIGIDEEGNILDAPPSYREFFMEETRRSIGL